MCTFYVNAYYHTSNSALGNSLFTSYINMAIVHFDVNIKPMLNHAIISIFLS
jgi:hypothetical protein